MGIFDRFKKANHPSSREDFEKAAEPVRAAVRAGVTGEAVVYEAGALLSLVEANPGSEDLFLEVLAPILTEDNHAGAGMIAALCGSHVSDGANPDIIAPALVEGYAKALAPAKEFLQACLAQPLPEEVRAQLMDPNGHCLPVVLANKHLELFGGRLIATNPEWANAWESLSYFGLAGSAVFSRSAKARALAIADPQLENLLAYLAPFAPNADINYRLIGMLDEEIVVLHQETKQGFRVHISAIETNYQLHTLLGAAVNGEGMLPFDRPSAEEIAAAKREEHIEQAPQFTGLFNMVNWTQFAPNLPQANQGASTDSSRHWIWNEGVPADIFPFQGTRVVVIEEAPYKRTWEVGDVIPAQPARCEVVGRLSAAEVEEWFAKFAQATEV